MTDFERYTKSEIHWRLIDATESQRALDEPYAVDGWVAAQALFCPYYVTLEGGLGGDWGVIVNPVSAKFGKLVFEHEWCGCPTTPASEGEPLAHHGEGRQRVDEWVVPSCSATHTFRGGGWTACHRPKGHKGRHHGRGGSWR